MLGRFIVIAAVGAATLKILSSLKELADSHSALQAEREKTARIEQECAAESQRIREESEKNSRAHKQRMSELKEQRRLREPVYAEMDKNTAKLKALREQGIEENWSEYQALLNVQLRLSDKLTTL